ncbi:MAG: hypothetical protein PWR19_785 [Carnobacterium sp.]|uniref:hypothetical protein n=1 Tax=Carnobacterium sp. TaxID=48221 RepID=UPI00264A49DC|nr:hypothetical protein [Carnobacterium sp.]MDN5371739.1 hypothetical protein [Carnobacterium sp.]
MTENHPIKFYGPNDLATSFELNKVQKYISEFDTTKSDYTLDNIVEIHNVLKYLKLSLIDNDDAMTTFQSVAKKCIGSYFAGKELKDLNEDYKNLYNLYKEDFWEVFVDYKFIKKTSVMQLQKFVEENQVSFGSLLCQKSICDKYNVMLKTMLLKEPRNFELFLRKYDSVSGEKYEFPKGFTNSEISNWARRYCELPDANTNYLKQLSLWSSKQEYKIEDKVLLKAKRASEQITSSYFKVGTGFSWGIGVTIKPDVPEGIAFESSDERLFQVYFDKNWLDDEQDYPTLLNNFIYLFNFFDIFGRFSLIGSQYSSGSLFDMIQTESKYAYKHSLDFNIKRQLYKLSFLAYFDYLAHSDIDMEELFSFCYNELFADAFKNDQFFFTASPEENNFYIRSKSLLPEMDSILKQFDFYQEDGEIDHELFELQSKNNGYRNIKSLTQRKFIYIKAEELLNLCHLLFDNQSRLSFPEKKSGESSFYYYVQEGVTLHDFYDSQQKIISGYLKVHNIIDYDVSNRIYFKNITLINLYKIIWDAGYCSLIEFSDSLLQMVHEEVVNGNLRYGNTLFSEQESDYISYIMDDKKFNNGLAIRNKMTHGSFAKKSAKEHKDYYLELLMILMLYTVRINEELDYQDKQTEGTITS